jgi:drug/metabolite transporter (DMT)-like permease
MKNQNLSSTMPLDRSAFAPFLIFSILLGGSPVAIRIIFAELEPFYLGLIRYSLGAGFYWVLALLKGMRVPSGRALLGAVLYGVFGFGASFLMLSWGLVKTPASLGSILMALLPLMTIFLSSVQQVEAITMRGVIGALLAIAGIALTVSGAPGTNISIPHIAALITGTAFMAQGNVVIKRFPRNEPIMTNAIAMTAGTSILGFASLLSGEVWLIPSLSSTWIALGYQVIPVTILAFFLYTEVLNKWTASATSYAFVIIPLVTTGAAVLLTGEQITAEFVIGTVLVLTGVVVGALLPGKKEKSIRNEQLEDCMPC